MTSKIILTALIFAVSCISLNAQNVKSSDVPSTVKTKFSTMYPAATGVQWEMENKYYEAEFKENNIETSVIIDANANYIQTEVEIPVSSLPQSIRDYVSANIKNQSIKEATQISSADGVLTYEIEVGNADYLFSDAGSLLRKKIEDGKDDDN